MLALSSSREAASSCSDSFASVRAEFSLAALEDLLATNLQLGEAAKQSASLQLQPKHGAVFSSVIPC